MAFLEWLQFTPPANFVAEALWAYPLFETLHTLGMALLIGSLGLINLRILGFKPELPLVGTLDLLPLAWLGFSINLVSGLALFISDAVYFWSSTTFRIKLGLILFAGINAFVLSQSAFRQARAAGAADAVGAADAAGAADAVGAADAGGHGAGVGARSARRAEARPASPGIRLVAGSSLLFWLAAVVAGRLIAYLP